tara:strand:+ start:888 stop:2321 length:1434 start_codon:yes stop_codon:yes gene_type:complete
MSWINKESQNGNSDIEKDYPFARWMSWLFLLVSLLMLIYTFFQAEIINNGQLFGYYFDYYLISIVGFLFWAVVLRLGKEIRTNIVTIVTTMIVGLYLFEGVLIWLEHTKPSFKENIVIAKQLGVEYDERTKLELIEDLIAEGVDALPTVQAQLPEHNEKGIDSLLTLGGVSNRTTVYGNESGKYLIYESDRYGFNNPDSQWDSQTIEWMLIGDSFVHGASVQPGEEISGQIRFITGDDAISLGISGNEPLLEYASIIEYAEAVKPKKVLWFYYEGNDIQSLVANQNDSFIMQYMEDGFSQNLINRQKEIDDLLEKYIVKEKEKEKEKMKDNAEESIMKVVLNKTKWIRLIHLRDLMGFFERNTMHSNEFIFSQILAKAKERVGAWNGKLYFVYLPEYTRYSNKFIFHNQFRSKSSVIDIVKELNIPVIDIHQAVFAFHPDPLALFPFRQPGHYNADGYRGVAKAVVTSVNKYEQSNK